MSVHVDKICPKGHRGLERFAELAVLQIVWCPICDNTYLEKDCKEAK